MIIKKLSDVPFAHLEGDDRVKKRIVLGPDDGSHEIVLRYFSIEPGGVSPQHRHDFPHLVKIESGKGLVIGEMDNEYHLKPGDYVYIDSNEIHQLKNIGSKPFDFICIIPRRGER